MQEQMQTAMPTTMSANEPMTVAANVPMSVPMKDQLVIIEQELIDAAKHLLKTSSDPMTAVIRFLHERPDNTSLPGYVIDAVLIEAFGASDKIPGLISVLAVQVQEIRRQANTIKIINHNPTASQWGNYLIKKTETVRFEIAKEKDKLVLKNIVGMQATELGLEAQLERVLINPPKLEIGLKLGMIPVMKVVDIV
jgi:hypothetical protein